MGGSHGWRECTFNDVSVSISKLPPLSVAGAQSRRHIGVVERSVVALILLVGVPVHRKHTRRGQRNRVSVSTRRSSLPQLKGSLYIPYVNSDLFKQSLGTGRQRPVTSYLVIWGRLSVNDFKKLYNRTIF